MSKPMGINGKDGVMEWINRVLYSTEKFFSATVNSKSNKSISNTYFKWTMARARGPGGQNVNKRTTSVQLSIDGEKASEWIPSEVILKMFQRHKRPFEVRCDSHRMQEMNRAECLDRFRLRLMDAAVLCLKKDKPPSFEQSTKVNRLKYIEKKNIREDKEHRSNKKSQRSWTSVNDDKNN